MPSKTQHEVLIGILQNSKKPQSLDEVQKFIDRIRPMPRSTTRARLTELKHKGLVDHSKEGWIITDTNGVPTITPTVVPFEQRVESIGVEIEGGYDKHPKADVVGDGSVHCGGNHTGEVRSKPSTLEEVLKFTDENYPEIMDRSCGLHIHVSFTNKLAYMQLMSRTFYYKWFLPRAEKWGKDNQINEGSAYWVRLQGKKSGAKYCMKGFHAEKQSKLREKDGNLRYHHLNYCYKQHTTIECRLFPTFQKKELSIKAIEFFVNTCNEFLATCKPEPTHHAQVSDDDFETESFDV